MTMPHLDVSSLITGAIGSPVVIGSIIAAIQPIPKMLVNRVKAAVAKAAAKGEIDAPTLRLLTALGRAVFDWADAELPNVAGPEKMDAILNRLAALPYLGVLVRADRADAKRILQAEYDAMKTEIDAEKAAEDAAAKAAADKAAADLAAPAPAAEPPAPAA